MDRALRHAFAALALTIACATAAPARGALPPAYGGVVRWPAPHAVGSPSPTAPRSPFEAALARAVYGGLYELDERGDVVPELAEGLPEPTEGGHRIRLRRGLLRHDGRPLEASDVVRSLERTFAATSGFLLAPLANADGSLAATIDADGAVVLRHSLSGEELARRLAALPCAIVPAPTRSGRSRGTGPFRAVPTADGLELRAFRGGVPAAPYLGTIAVSAPRAPERELRDLELGRLHASWFGASLYGTTSLPTETLELARAGVVLVVADRRAHRALSWLAAHVDRARLQRVGVVPRESLSAELRPPALGNADRPGPTVIRVDPQDSLASAVARELSAQADALGVPFRVVAPSAHASEPALRIVTVVPPLPGAAPTLAAAFAAAGQAERAAAVGVDLDRAREAAPRLAAVVLGMRRDVLFHRRGLDGLRSDAYGLPALAELHVRRRSEILAEATGGAR